MTLARNIHSIESERLVLRRITPKDFEFFGRLHADPEVVRYIGQGSPSSWQESLAWLRSTLALYESLSLGQLAVVRKRDGELVGRCGLSDLSVEAHPVNAAARRVWYQRAAVPPGIELLYERELGYTFERSQWGHGYASEAVRCIFEYVSEVLKLPRVISIIHPENGRSLRVAQRFGLEKEDVVSLAASPRERYVWPRSLKGLT